MTHTTHIPTHRLHQGHLPLLVSLPHVGVAIAPEVAAALHPRALSIEDTDWHLDRLYGFVVDWGASLIVPHHSRFVIDLNRPSNDQPMYPGVHNTELCPTRFFSGDPLYREGMSPNPAEVSRRVQAYWQPYHEALRTELHRLRALHGYALLWDGHSIRSELPWLFAGRLPDLNLGTANGASCAPSLRALLCQTLHQQQSFSVAIDGRFKGGHITRHYGQPSQGIHAVQMEQCWSSYMAETPPWVWEPARAHAVQQVLRALLQTLLAWRP